MNPIVSGIILCLSYILVIPPTLAGNTSSYRYTFNGSTVTPTSSTSTDPQVDDPTATDTADDTSVDNSDPSTAGETTDPTEAAAGDVTETAPETGTESTVSINDIPVANHDSISTEQNTPANIVILANDSGLNDIPLTLSILAPTEHGQLIVEADNSITYIPDIGFMGSDSIIYEVIDNNGDKAIANAAIEVQCSACPADILLTLTWNPNPDEVLGYAVYFGPSAGNATQLVSELSLVPGLLDPLAPSVQYHLGNDLGLTQGDSVCFRLKAYNTAGYSDYSAAACIETII